MDSTHKQDSPAGLKRKREVPFNPAETGKQNDVAVALAKPLIIEKINDESNFVFSPLSIQIALGLIAAGSGGSTRDQILSFLKSNSIDELNATSSFFATTVLADGTNRGGPVLSCANGIWIDQSASFKSHFMDVIHGVYQAHASQVDFQNKANEVVAEMNAWAEKETKGTIKNILTNGAINRLTTLILTNAVYFKGAWVRNAIFHPPLTRDYKFYLLNGSTVDVPFMTSTNSRQYVSAYDDFQVLRLPYKQGNDRHRNFSMYLFLPDAKDGLQALVEKINSEPGFIKNHLPRTEESVGSYLVPKFKISFEFEASKILKGLGLVSPFAHDGGLTEMVASPMGDKLFVQSMFQKSFIEVNEKGTEAAAISIVLTGGGAPEQTFDFVADHPFLFLIREDVRGVVLFMGSVLNPLGS